MKAGSTVSVRIFPFPAKEREREIDATVAKSDGIPVFIPLKPITWMIPVTYKTHNSLKRKTGFTESHDTLSSSSSSARSLLKNMPLFRDGILSQFLETCRGQPTLCKK